MIINHVDYKRKCIVRVIMTRIDGSVIVGTGFTITNSGKILTCFHVVFGQELSNLRVNSNYVAINDSNEHTKLETYFNQQVKTIQIEFFNKTKKTAKLVYFDEKYDIALLELEDKYVTSFLKLNWNDSLNYDEAIFFCGFPLASGYSNPEEYPFATNRGIVSSFPTLIVAGAKYEHIQLNSINLGGNSGAPLFRENSNDVVGIVNGIMTWGSNNLASINFLNGLSNLTQTSLIVPLSITFSTSLRLIKENTNIYKKL